MHVEQAAVEIRHLAKQLRQFRGAVGLRLAQPLMEQLQEEQAVETDESALSLPLPHRFETITQVVHIVVEESTLLDEIDEHHPVQHQRGVPFAVGQVPDPLDEPQKGLMPLFEAVVEPPGDLLYVKGSPHPARYIDDGQAFFFVQREDEILQLLDKPLSGIPVAVGLRTLPIRLAGFAFYPLPGLLSPVVGGVNDDVFTHLLRDGSLDLPAGGIVGKRRLRVGDILVGDHAALLGDDFEGERTLVYANLCVNAPMVPTKFLDKERSEVEFLQIRPDFVSVQSHRHSEHPDYRVGPGLNQAMISSERDWPARVSFYR